MDALGEAHTLARAGHFDERLAETIRLADELLDIVAEGTALAAHPKVEGDLDAIRGRLRDFHLMSRGSKSRLR